MSRLSEKLASNDLIITAEITPPKGAGIKKLIHHAETIGPFVDAINITDCQRAMVKMSSLAACRVILDCGFEPVYQLTCRDRNGIAMQSDLMGAAALKIPNLLCLTGDSVKVGDHPTSKPVFEMESTALLKLVGKLQSGRDGMGHKMNAPTKFTIGAVVNPTLRHGEGQFNRMLKKIDAGATFFQTQANYDLKDFVTFLEKTKTLNAKVLAGVLVLHSKEIAEFIHENIPGIQIPDELLARFRSTTTPEAGLELGIEFAVETMLATRSHCAGFHLMTIREEELIPRILEQYNERIKTL